MAPVELYVPRFAAEPPQEGLPYGRWAERLAAGAAGGSRSGLSRRDRRIWASRGRSCGTPTAAGTGTRTCPRPRRTSAGYELFGYVRFVPAGEEGGEPGELTAHVDFTDQTAAENPGWSLDLCDEVVGRWRGQDGEVAAMTLVWGRPLVAAAAPSPRSSPSSRSTAASWLENRFTLLAPDDYRDTCSRSSSGARKGKQLARESLYEGE